MVYMRQVWFVSSKLRELDVIAGADMAAGAYVTWRCPDAMSTREKEETHHYKTTVA